MLNVYLVSKSMFLSLNVKISIKIKQKEERSMTLRALWLLKFTVKRCVPTRQQVQNAHMFTADRRHAI